MTEQKESEEPKITPPWKHAPFWISLVTMNLCFLVASNILPLQVGDWVVILLASLTHLGYGVSSHWRRQTNQLKTDKLAWKRKAFWGSWVACMASFGLGSGDPTIAHHSGHVAVVLGYLGMVVKPWLQSRGMMDPESTPVKFWQKVIEIVLSPTKRKAKLESSEETDGPE